MPPWCRNSTAGTLLDIVVQPKSSREGIGPVHADRLRVRVHAPPADNEANAAVVALVADRLGVPKRNVTITTGHAGRRKTLLVAGVRPETVLARLGEEARPG